MHLAVVHIVVQAAAALSQAVLTLHDWWEQVTASQSAVHLLSSEAPSMEATQPPRPSLSLVNATSFVHCAQLTDIHCLLPGPA